MRRAVLCTTGPRGALRHYSLPPRNHTLTACKGLPNATVHGAQHTYACRPAHTAVGLETAAPRKSSTCGTSQQHMLHQPDLYSFQTFRKTRRASDALQNYPSPQPPVKQPPEAWLLSRLEIVCKARPHAPRCSRSLLLILDRAGPLSSARQMCSPLDAPQRLCWVCVEIERLVVRARAPVWQPSGCGPSVRGRFRPLRQ